MSETSKAAKILAEQESWQIEQIEETIQQANHPDTQWIAKRLFEKSHSSLHSPPSPPILRDSDPQSPPELGDLGGECNVFATFQTASQFRSR
jgi:hypothetical protein